MIGSFSSSICHLTSKGVSSRQGSVGGLVLNRQSGLVSFVYKIVIRSTIDGLMTSMSSRGQVLDILSTDDISRLVVCCALDI